MPTSNDDEITTNRSTSVSFIHRYYLLLKAHYFLFFAGYGIVGPITSITLASRGLTNLEISYINLIIPFLIFLSNPFVGLIADRTRRYRLTVNIMVCLTVIFYSVLFILPSIKTYNIKGDMHQVNTTTRVINLCANKDLATKCAARGECGCVYQAHCTPLARKNNFRLHREEIDTVTFNFSMHSKYVQQQPKNMSTSRKKSSRCTIDYQVSIDQALSKSIKSGIDDPFHISDVRSGTENSHLATCEITCTIDDFCHGSRHPGQIIYVLLYGLIFILGATVFSNGVALGTSLGFAVLPHGGLFGKQRVFATVGFGLSAVVASRLYARFKSDYVYMYMFIATSILTVIVTSFLRIQSHRRRSSLIITADIPVKEELEDLSLTSNIQKTKAKKKKKPKSKSPALNVRALIPLFKKIDVIIFLSLAFIWGTSYAPLDPYLSLYVDDIASCNSHSIIGWMALISAAAEFMAFFLADTILKRLGTNISSILILLAFAIRFSGYYFIHRPKLILPMELMHFFNSGILFVLIAQKADAIAPTGLSVTLQSMTYSICFGLGRGIGLLVSLFIFTRFPKRRLFLIYAIFNLGAAIVYSFYFLWTKQLTVPSTKSNDESNNTPKNKNLNEEPLLSSPAMNTNNNNVE